MSDPNQQQQIPAGFTPEVWNSMTPQQQQQYLQGAQQPQQPMGGVNPQQQQADMASTMKKTMILSMVFSFLSSMVYGLIRMFTGRND